MKTILNYTLVLFAGLSIALSCSKINEVNVIEPDKEGTEVPVGKQITINATLSDALTRVEYSYDESGPKLSLKWESTDILVVSNSSNSVELTDPTIDETGKTAIFTGTLPEGGEPYTVSVKHAGTNLGATQTQVADGDLTHLEYAAMATGVTEADFEDLNLTQTTGVLGLIAKIPTVVSASVKAVIFQTENALFNGSNTLTVNLGTPGAGTDNILYVYANVAAQTIPAGTEMFIRFKVSDGDYDYYTRYQVFASEVSLTNGALNGLKLNCSHIDRYAGKDDKGTEAAPYLIADMYQLKAVQILASTTAKTYFKMIDDVDMSGMTGKTDATTYIPVNKDVPDYTKVVDFDGNNKTISNLGMSLFYVLKGSAYDLTLDGCQVSTRGVLSEYIQGTGNVVSDVTVSNGKVNTSNNNAGALIGTINSGSGTCATISDCTVSNTDVTGVGVVGGLIGFADQLVQISGCSFIGGTVTASARYAGGLLGSTGNYNSVISDCHVENTTISITVSNNDFRAGGLIGQLQTKVQVKGCSVGKSGDNVILNLSAPTSGKVYNAGGFVGVGYGTITKNGDVRSASYVTINAGNEVGNAQLNLGGFVGYNTGKIEYSDAIVSASSVVGSHIGGFAGYALQNSTIENCTATGAVSGTQKTGGFVGVAENGSVNECLATTVVSKFGSATGSGEGTDFGGFVGIVTQTATLIKCSSDADIEINTNYVGGFAGSINPAADKTAKISKCWSKGNVKSNAAQCGGFIGHIAANATGTVLVEDCYTVGSLIETNQRQGGLIGQINSGVVTVNRCYAAGTVSGSFAIGGLIGFMNSTATITNCAAWNATVTPKTYGDGNWSSGAVIGVAWPVATLSNNYRKSDMSLTAWWVPDADYNHPDVSSSSPLIVKDKTDGTLRPTTATSAANGQDNYPQFAFHGKVEDGKTLSQLASTTLGWSSDVWDFTGDLPSLK